MYIIKIWSFSKARDICCSEVMSEYSKKKSLQKHPKSGIVEKVMHIIHLSHVLQGEVVQVFLLFLLNTHWKFSCRVFSSWTPLQCIVLNFKKTSHISWKWKINWSCEWLIGFVLACECIGFLYCFYMVVIFCSNHSHKKQKDSLEGSLDQVSFASELEFPKILVPRLPQYTLNVNIECAGKREWSKQLCSLYLTSFLEHCIWICF